MNALAGQALFGRVAPELTPLLEAGLIELNHDEREALVVAIERAQATLRDQCLQAVFASGRAEYLCPPTADELLHYTAHRIQLKR